MSYTVGLIFLAGGHGSRFGSLVPKQFLPLLGAPLALRSFHTLLKLPHVSTCAIVCEPSYEHLFTSSLIDLNFALPGIERQYSVMNGFEKLPSTCSHVLIHDSARPLITLDDALRLLTQGLSFPAAALACPVTSTIKEASPNGIVSSTLDRSKLWEVQTPQLMRYDILKEGLKLMQTSPYNVTDDVSIAEHLGYSVKLITNSPLNIKVTLASDLPLAEYYASQLKSQELSHV